MGVGETKPSVELLHTYLNDHLAGSVGGSSLAQSAASRNEGTSVGTFLTELQAEIEIDRHHLETLMERLGIEPSITKQAVSRLAERLSWLKLNDLMAGSRHLRLLLELETLALGIRGKLLLWQALREMSGPDHRLAETDLDELIRRAEGQLEELERHRLAAARAAFSQELTAQT